jgi:hypothetical protein
MLLQGWVDDTQYANGNRVAALYDYVRIYSWPTGRRLDDGTFLFLQRTLLQRLFRVYVLIPTKNTPTEIVPRCYIFRTFGVYIRTLQCLLVLDRVLVSAVLRRKTS